MCAVESVVSLVTWELRVGILACVFLIIQSILPMGYNAVGKAHGAAALLAFLGVLILIAIDCKAAAMCFPTTTTVGTIAGFILWAVAAASIGLWLATFFDVYDMSLHFVVSSISCGGAWMLRGCHHQRQRNRPKPRVKLADVDVDVDAVVLYGYGVWVCTWRVVLALACDWHGAWGMGMGMGHHGHGDGHRDGDGEEEGKVQKGRGEGGGRQRYREKGKPRGVCDMRAFQDTSALW
eukprot:CAMPEP_0118981870 /NCGR_PEP_ID=MMETSP1173-20130426/31529_1 /TAXON_ID=1034831 /ORGANISM="Rhizochromulina marina cf, Strain CCMP1243" /LENGTH=235 /DNA_ID=CAMNT_0006932323 /DNA_START=335 /DNA_END=1040 /DNA_ORIENTATION=-